MEQNGRRVNGRAVAGECPCTSRAEGKSVALD